VFIYVKDGRTVLHIAAQNGHSNVVETLLKRCFDVAARDKVAFWFQYNFRLHHAEFCCCTYVHSVVVVIVSKLSK